MASDFETVPLGTSKKLQEMTLWKVSVWEYHHQYGTDVVCVLAPKHHQVTWEEVVDGAHLHWEGPLLKREIYANIDREVRYGETLTHVLDLPLTLEALRAVIPEVGVL